MKIQVNTDNQINGSIALQNQIQAKVESALDHVSSHITRIEVHLSDVNGGKTGGDDIKCMIEARMEGRQPIAVTHNADEVGQAVDGAAEKMAHMVGSILDRQRDIKRHQSDPLPRAEGQEYSS